MRLVSEIRGPHTVAERWREAYFRNGQWRAEISNRRSPQAIYERLIAMPAGATEADVEAIIGNDSWCGVPCIECAAENAAVVEIGAEAYICRACLREALELAGPGTAPEESAAMRYHVEALDEAGQRIGGFEVRGADMGAALARAARNIEVRLRPEQPRMTITRMPEAPSQ